MDDNILISAGKTAGSIMTVLGLLTAVFWKWTFGKLWNRRKDRREAEKREDKAFKEAVLKGIESIAQDVGDLQCDRLTQAHDYYMGLGYCPTTTKQVLVHMHSSYRSKGRNHLCDHYEQDILDLPAQDGAETG